jgi:phosphoribosyl 1,2-cyclic phosphodiesterase
MGKKAKETNYIKFLGTAGARFVVSKQLRASGGVWFSINGSNILVDPGPGSLVRCTSSRPKLDPLTLDYIIVTHRHLDHCADVNVMIEAMTEGGFKKKGTLFTTEEALTDDPVVFQYVRKYLNRIELLKEGKSYTISDTVSFTTPIRHDHPAETYGLNFKTPLCTISHIIDTSFFPELTKVYRGDILIMNIVRYKSENDRARGILHLNLNDARRIISETRPKVAILTHFGMTMIKAKTREIAAQLTKELKTRVIAASDGMRLDLASLLEGSS